ncbi:MAG: enoyl-CoA hydratase/isomerase family protein [Alphaproteobacteria bacterium]
MSEIMFEVGDGLGLVTLNRPRALNALSLEMALAFKATLDQWAENPAIEAVVVRGAGERAFCAGGDVRALYHAGKGAPEGYDFYYEEYRLNRAIFRLGKPYIALMDGVVMGGGAGLSVHGSHRVVTERTLFAMPETALGLFPDIGAGYFLPRCPGRLGLYLALTGVRIDGSDCLYAGLATHFLDSGAMAGLVAKLADADKSEAGIAAALGSEVAGNPSQLAKHRSEIDHCFGGGSVRAILDALDSSGSDWAKETAAVLRTRSPMSLELTFRQMEMAVGLDIEEILRMEFRLSQRCMAGHDFYEGVRAILVDKDHAPRWQPDSLDGVTGADLDAYFAPLSEELQFT